MYVKQIKAVNFKGRTFDLMLDPVTVIAGDNFSGKTAVPMALRLALTGYLPPPIGKTAQAIYALAGDPEAAGTMEVEARTDTGRGSKLTFSRTVKGKISMDGGVPADLALPGLLVEPLTFFGLTGAQRIEAVFAACDPKKIGVKQEDLLAKLRGIQAMPARAAEEIVAQMSVSVRELLVAKPITQALTFLEDEWKEEAKTSKSLLAQAQANLGALSNISRERPGWDSVRAKQIDDELEGINLQEPASLRDALRKLSFAEDTVVNADSDIHAAEHALSQFDDLDCCPTCKAKAKGWKDAVLATLKEAVGQAKAARSVASLDFIALEKVAKDEESKWKKVQEAEAEKQKQLLVERNAIMMKRGEDEAWARNIKSRDAAEVNVLKLGAAVTCYTEGVKLVREVREEAVGRVFGEVLSVANQFTADLLNSPVEFVEGQLGRRVSQADRDDGNTASVGSWIAHEAFSGTEQLLAYAGFAVALSRQAPIKLVIMDELGRLTVNRRAQLLARMRKLVETGVVDQFVGCDAEALDGTAAKYIML